MNKTSKKITEKDGAKQLIVSLLMLIGVGIASVVVIVFIFSQFL